MSKKYDGLAMLVSVLWWIGGILVVVGAALHAGEMVQGLALMFGGLGLIFGNVQLYLFVEIARDLHELVRLNDELARLGGGGEKRQNRVKTVKNRMKITKQGETEQ